MLIKLKLLFFISLFFVIAPQIRAEVIVQLKPPPPGKLNVENLWSVTLKNMSQSTFKVYLLGQLTEATDGLIFEATTKEFDLPPGTTTVTVSEVSPISAKFPKEKYKSVLMQTGEVPSGNYTICLNVQMKNGSVLGTQCIPHTVNNVSGISLIAPENEASISEKNPSFSWAPLPGTGNQYKFILAEKNGTPQQSLLTPEYETTQNATFLVYPVSATTLTKGKTYYWQVGLLDYKGEIIASSKSVIRSFSVPGDVTPPVAGDGFIQLLNPGDNGDLNTSNIKISQNNSYQAFKFEWKKANTNKSITAYILKIYKIKNGNGRNNLPSTPDYKKEITNFNYNADIQTTEITVEQGILDKGSEYFWKVEAFSQSYINQNNGIVGKSDVYQFKVIGGEDLIEVNKFTIGKYEVDVSTVSNKSPTNFAGDGIVKLWEGGPQIYIKYDNLTLEKNGLKWKVKTGKIQNEIPNNGTSFKLEHSETKSTFFGKTINLTVNDATIQGYVVSTFPLSSAASGPHNSNKVIIQSAKTWFKIDPVNKLSVDNLLCDEDASYDLLEPSGFTLNFLSLKTFFTVKNNVLTLKLGGSIELPAFIKNSLGVRTSIAFADKTSLKFPLDLGTASFTVPLNKNKDLSLYVTNVLIDLVPKGTWKGGIKINKGKIYFPVNMGFNDIELTSDNILGEMIVNSKGVTAKTDITGMSYNKKFFGFDCNVNKFYLDVKNNAMQSCYFKGSVYIPVVSLNLNYQIPISDFGIGKGFLEIPADLGSMYLFGNNSSEYDRLKISLKNATIKENKITFQSELTLDNTQNKNLSTGTMNAYEFFVKSDGAIGFNETAGTYSFLNLDNYSDSKYNGYDVSISKLRFRNLGGGNYYFDVGGKIILAEDLSGTDGSDFGLSYKFYRNPNKGGSGPEISYANEVEQNGINVSFQNSESSYSASITYATGDPVYGSCFTATFNMAMHNPTEYSVSSRIILGKAPEGFKYWFVEASAEFLSSPIAIGIGDLGIYGFKGRIYSKMKHTGIGISNNTYVPDGGTTFGVYAEVPFLSTTDNGNKIWGKTSLEVIIGNGFKSILTGNVYILSDGVGNTNAKIYGDAVIIVSTSPAYFSADVNVAANFDGVVCGNGHLALYFGSDTWYLNVGTKEQPITMNMYCGSTTATAYIDLNSSNIAFGAGYHVDTGPQHWAIFYGRAQGGVNIDGVVAYSPFQFSGKAVITGSAELGFHYDIGIHEGNLTVLSGSVTASLEAQLPNPVCFAGKISAKGCIWKFCKTVTLKLRYRNGSFAFEDHC